MKALMKTAVALFVFLAVFGLVVSIINPESMQAQNEDAAEMNKIERPDLDFEVIKDDSDAYKRSVEVVLSGRISEDQLESLAEYLYEERPGNTFIGYYIEGEGDYAYWATTHYDPDLNVRIIGSSQEQEQQMETASSDTPRDVIGRWRVNRGYSSVITIFNEDGQKRLSQKFQDGSEMDNPIQEQVVNGETRLSDGIGESNGEYYVIGDDGRLQFWSDNGNYYTAPIDD